MSLAADVGLFETLLISKFGFKVSTTHSAFAGDWAPHCFIYTSRNQLILFWLHFPKMPESWCLGFPCLLAEPPVLCSLGFCTMLDIGRPLYNHHFERRGLINIIQPGRGTAYGKLKIPTKLSLFNVLSLTLDQCRGRNKSSLAEAAWGPQYRACVQCYKIHTSGSLSSP